MIDAENLVPGWIDLFDDYLSGAIDDAGLAELEALLKAEAGARRAFVAYCRMHADIYTAVRAEKAGKEALKTLGESEPRRPPSFLDRASSRIVRAVTPWTWRKACVWILAGSLAIYAAREAARARIWQAGADPAVAWLVNAQDCQWADGMAPSGNMRLGRLLRIERGLAQIGFASGAHIVLEGPASLELLSGTTVRLIHGKAAARVPESAKGFTILSPQGKVVDLGTEFGISVSKDGATDVFVFEGTVEAASAKPGNPPVPGVTIHEHEGVHIDGEGVSPKTISGKSQGASFVRTIAPQAKPAPRALKLDFAGQTPGGIKDASGLGTGLTHRLPGTGERFSELDSNLKVNPAERHMELTTTNSDINTQFLLYHGEYLGVRLADLGFQGAEDFAVTVTIPKIPKLEVVGQFGLFAGTKSDKNIRGGLISRQDSKSYEHFLVNNNGGRDSDLYTVGLLSTGDDLRLTLRRVSGKFTLTVENLTAGSSSTLAIRHPDFLDGEQDILVGVFGANTQSEVTKTLIIKKFEATVWTRS